MTTFKFKELIALQFPFFEDRYQENFKTFKNLINQSSSNSIIVAPELCLSNFSFSCLDKAAKFSQKALEELLKLSKEKVITFSMIEKIGGSYYNSAKVLYQKRIVHSQEKVGLFKLGDEDKYFQTGEVEKIKIFEIEGLKFAILICFEIRFIEFWQRIKGADIILVPALWGRARKEHFEAITKALAIINQAFVIASNSSNENMASSSGIITPFGKEYRNDNLKSICVKTDFKEIKKMRRYLDIGLT